MDSFYSIINTNKCANTITVKYNDGEKWKYNYNLLLKYSGHYSNLILPDRYESVKYIHYQNAEQINNS